MYNCTDIKLCEDLAFQKLGLSPHTLMQRAGEAAFNILQKYYPKAKKIAVICGNGNNAGDGYVAAAMAKKAGKTVTCFYLKDPQQLKQPALSMCETAQANQVTLQSLSNQRILPTYDVIIDALLGTGFKGKLQPDVLTAINAINQTNKPVIAIDVPSGLDADTGNVSETAVKAAYTVTYIALKQGLFTADALDYCGKIFLEDLGLSKDLFAKIPPSAKLIDFEALKNNFLLPRRFNSHKGEYGHAAVIGGDLGMAGAVRMTSEACARVGAGLTSAYTHPEHVSIITTARPEIMAHAIPDPNNLATLLTRATVLALGPGLGRRQWGEVCFSNVIQLDKPKVIDADAIGFLANSSLKSDAWILTPHPKEAATLLNTTTKVIQADRFTAIRQLQKQYGGTIVLKGAGTLIYDGKSPIYICNAGNPGMASGGMGDILTGIIAGLVAQQIPLFQAACLGVYLHATAGDLCAKAKGERGMLALDVLPYIRSLIN